MGCRGVNPTHADLSMQSHVAAHGSPRASQGQRVAAVRSSLARVGCWMVSGGLVVTKHASQWEACACLHLHLGGPGSLFSGSERRSSREGLAHISL